MDLFGLTQELAGGGGLRLRQATVTGVSGNGTLVVRIAGSSTSITGVKALAHVCPKQGATVWLATDGVDLLAIGTVTPVGPAYASVQRTTAQTLTTGTDTYVDFLASATVTDTHGMWSAGATDRLTVQVPGVYLLTAHVVWEFSSVGRRDTSLRVNGGVVASSYEAATPTVRGNRHAMATAVALAAGDYLQINANHSSGANLTLAAGADAQKLTATWLRPVTS